MSNAYSWYQTLIKPGWAPPSYLFSPVWTILYILIAISYGTVFWKIYKRKLPATISLPFILNLIFNLMFTPIQFGFRNNYLAAVDIILVLITLVWIFVLMYDKIKWIALMQLPYLFWVAFATILQLTVTYLNR